MEYIIELENICLSSQNFEVLKDISLKIPAKKCTIIMGPSGGGKSTLLKLLACILLPESGNVYIEGNKLLSLSEKKMMDFRKRSSFVFEDSALWANKNIFDNLALPLNFHYPELTKMEVNDEVKRALQKLDLVDSAYLRPAQLSTGEQKGISFMRALVTRPSILFLDEPTLSVDHKIKDMIMKDIKLLKEKECSIISVSHDPKFVSLFADYFIILNDGEVIETGDVEKIKKSQKQEVRDILSEVLKEVSSYDSELLDLLSN